MTQTPNDRVLIEFMTRYLEDREANQVKSLSAYLADYPGNEASVAQYYLGMEAEGLDTDGVITPRELSTVDELNTKSSAKPSTADVVGPYRIIEEIGRGGQAIVYSATDIRLNRKVALKVLSRSGAGSDSHFLRFRREAEIVAGLEMPGICPIFDVGEDAGVSYIAMQFVEGKTLQDEIKTRGTRPSTAPEIKRVAHLIGTIARTLHAAHEVRIIHRDLKPANIMVNENDEPILLDFGLARAEDLDTLTHSDGGLQGTPAYMSPEQITGRPLDPRSDVYALGATLYFALTHEHPFKGATLQVLSRRITEGRLSSEKLRSPHIPLDLRVIVETTLATDPAQRYHSAEALADDLEAFAENRPISARPPSLWRRGVTWARQHPVAAVSASFVATGMIIGAVLGSIYLQQQAQAERLEQRQSKRIKSELSRFRRAEATLDIQKLIEAEGMMHPAGPELVEPIRNWISEAKVQLINLPGHRAVLAELQGAADEHLSLSARDKRWLTKLLNDLVASAQTLENLKLNMESRLRRASTLYQESIGDHKVAWSECIAAIAASDMYNGLELQPQVGLVPLGENEESRLWEFWHVASGAKPRFDARRERWYPSEGSGFIMTLIPGGRFRMGRDHDTPKAYRRPDGIIAVQSDSTMGPPHDVELCAFFMSAYETTQDQWVRITGKKNPSRYFPGVVTQLTEESQETISILSPVESTSWVECHRFCFELGLQLPTEAQWEYAARGGTDTYWFFGDDSQGVLEHGNVKLLEWKSVNRLDAESKLKNLNDGRILHQRVGSYAPNQFGLYDTCGNVWEWCQDEFYLSYSNAKHHPDSGLLVGMKLDSNIRSYRGGSFLNRLTDSQSALRGRAPSIEGSNCIGFRVVTTLMSSTRQRRTK